MRSASTLASRFASIMLAALLTACAMPNKGAPTDDADHKAHHPEAAASSAPPSPAQRPGPTGVGQMGMMDSMDMKTMCDMHKKMMSSKTPAEREAMMDRNMKSMSPEMRQKHMEMMEAKCR